MLMLQSILAKLCHCSRHVLAPYFFLQNNIKAQVNRVTKCKHKSEISVSWGDCVVVSAKLKCIVKVPSRLHKWSMTSVYGKHVGRKHSTAEKECKLPYIQRSISVNRIILVLCL